MKLNTAVPTVKFEDDKFDLDPQLSLLDNLLHANKSIAYGCKSGVCQRCLLQISDGDIPANSQLGLSSVQKQQKLIMSCCAYPKQDICLNQAPQLAPKQIAEVIGVTQLSESILKVNLQLNCSSHSGQFIRLYRSASLARCYSLSQSPNSDNTVEMHIQLHPNGVFSQWAFERLQVGMPLAVEGPFGDCYYRKQYTNQPLLFICAQSGFAPALGIARTAIAQDHAAPITMVLIGHHMDRFYAADELAQLDTMHSNIRTYFYPEPPIELKSEWKKQSEPDKGSTLQAFVCGPKPELEIYPSLLQQQGLSSAQIHSEFFVNN
ncbi:hypothetical protein DBZ36_14555 [Alginatibacterium sediminis]|uniref:NQR complex subunit F n=1 Tax=Alginatibacterium sediminis TaxID=2164068 RepID=A0A420E871_9ALTE|nr:2Fe-2S iron-sulfur cluster binding domain-containing protein [Alginatibacterium sediminis]RKF15605.1 hypothetical protein DBZ36_14555 [Alginatibacterium sediminis]